MRERTYSPSRLFSRLGKPATAGRQSGFTSRSLRDGACSQTREAGWVGALISIRVLPLTGRYRSTRRTFLREQTASSIIETTVLLPVLLLLLIGAVDYGRGFYTAIEVSSAAESGAMYGTGNPTDNSGIVSMAKLDANDINLNVNANYGCECADGTSGVASCLTSITCSNNAVRYVDVSTSTVYTPMLPYPLIPSSFTLTGHSRMRMSN